MNIALGEHFDNKKLLRLIMPSVIMLIVTSVYGVVDGFFVSNFVGKPEFTAVNFIMPFLMILSSVGFLFGTGGGALIAKTFGEGKPEYANRLFSMVVYVSTAVGIALMVFGLIYLRPIAAWLGAEGTLLEDSVRYGRIILYALPFAVLQFEFQCLFPTANKHKTGLYITVASGIANMVFDFLFIVIFKWGLEGAAAATAVSQLVGGVLPLGYFARPNSGLLQLGKAKLEVRALWQTCLNGSSELMSNIAMSVVSMLYNAQLLEYAGEDGVAAYGVMLYVGLFFQSIFIGYSVGAAPVISYHYGAGNHTELQNLRRRSMQIVTVSAIAMFISSILLAGPIARLFVGYDVALYQMTVYGFYFFSASFLFEGYAIFGSAFFTALNNGPVSAAISFLRTLVFQSAAVILLPKWFGLDGIWLSITVAQMLALFMTLAFIAAYKKRYNY